MFTYRNALKNWVFLSSLIVCQSGWATPKVTLSIVAPVGSSAADSQLQTIYTSMPWLPCIADATTFGINPVNQKQVTNTKDALQFDITVVNEDINGNGIMDNDLYVFFLNPNASGNKEEFDAAKRDVAVIRNSAQIWAAQAPAFNDNPAGLLPFANLMTINPAKAIFRPASSFVTGNFKTTLFGGEMFFDGQSAGVGLPQGPWMIVAMLMDAKKFPFKKLKSNQLQNPQNWEAWDAKPFLLGTPFPKSKSASDGALRQCN